MNGVPTLAAEPVSAEHAVLGEGARWDGRLDELLWVDILKGLVRRAVLDADGALNTLRTYDVGAHVGAVTPLADGDGYLLAAAAGFRHLTDDGAVTVLAQPEAGEHGRTRMNDASCDPHGRFWAGTMAYDQTPGAGRLYRCDPDGSVVLVRGGYTIANGLGWSPDGRWLFQNDSGTSTITRFAAHDDGSLGPPHVVLDSKGDGSPDGLLVDAEGMLWAAMHGIGEVHRYDPSGRLLARVTMPVSQPSCPAIGGPGGTILYVSTARDGLSPQEHARQPHAGQVFAVDVGVSAPPVTPYVGMLPRA